MAQFHSVLTGLQSADGAGGAVGGLGQLIEVEEQIAEMRAQRTALEEHLAYAVSSAHPAAATTRASSVHHFVELQRVAVFVLCI